MPENRKKAPEGMYTAQEAIDVIGIPPSAFYGRVNAGEITRVVPKGRKEGFYPKPEVDRYARVQRALNAPYTNEKLDFVPAFNEDLPDIHDLVASVSGGEKHAVPVDILKGWIRRNPQSVHILRKKQEIKGYVALFPVQEETLLKRLSGELLNREIPFDDIDRFRPDSSILLYIAEMAVQHRPEYLSNNEPIPDKPDPKAAALGSRLIREISRFITDIQKQGIAIKGFYAVGTSPFGIELCRRIGMQPMDLSTGVREDRIPFCLDNLEDAKSIIVRQLARV